MESRVSFEEILDAFLSGDNGNCSLLMNKGILKCPLPAKEILLELKEKGIYPIPRRSKEFDKKVKETFVFEIADKVAAEEVFNAAMGSDAELFGRLIQEKNLSELFRKHEQKFSTDALINWMVKSGIDLPGQNLAPEITITNIAENTVPDEMKSLVPVSCNNCSNTLGFTPAYFRTSLPCDNLLMELNAKVLLAGQGFENFNFLGRERKELIAVSNCPRCKSTDLTWDFR